MPIRFGLSRLLIMVSVIAFFVAALKESTELWNHLTTTFTLACFTGALILALTSVKHQKLFWTAFLVAGVVHWHAATSGIDWLCVHPGDVVTQYWVLPARNLLHPSPGTEPTGVNHFVHEWRYFPSIATEANSLVIGLLSAITFQCGSMASAGRNVGTAAQ